MANSRFTKFHQGSVNKLKSFDSVIFTSICYPSTMKQSRLPLATPEEMIDHIWLSTIIEIIKRGD